MLQHFIYGFLCIFFCIFYRAAAYHDLFSIFEFIFSWLPADKECGCKELLGFQIVWIIVPPPIGSLKEIK